MADRLSTLKKSIQDMSLEELKEHVREIRADRRLSKRPIAIKKARAKVSDKAKGGAKKVLANMSHEELAALLKEFGDADAGN